MKVAIVHELLVKLGGAERVAKIFSEIFPTAPIFTLLFDEKKCGQTFSKNRVISSNLQKYFKFGIPRRFLISKMPTAIENFNLSDFDLVISSSSAFAHGIITNSATRHICYCHSPARYLWDQTFQVQKNFSNGFLGPVKKFFMTKIFQKLRIWDFAAASRPDKILANSKNVKQRITKFWQRDCEILFPPVKVENFIPQKSHQNYFLIISALSKFKNIEIAVRAFSKMPKQKLVIIGNGIEKKYLQKIAKKNIEFLGWQSDKICQKYLQNCRGFIFPGIDDFGIAPAEAMAAGKPVFAFFGGGAIETVIPKKTGEFFFQNSVENFLENFSSFLEKIEKFDFNKIRQWSEQFSESKFRKKILQELS